MQTGVTKIHTDHWINFADLTSTLKEVQSIIQKLAERIVLQQLRTQLENVQVVVSNSNEDVKLNATQTALGEARKNLAEVQNKVEDL